jgi:hypothetical protein
MLQIPGQKARSASIVSACSLGGSRVLEVARLESPWARRSKHALTLDESIFVEPTRA